jgi:hypothetical protein
MKIRPEHLEYIRQALANAGLTPQATMRERWDAAHKAGLTPWFCSTLYDYLNDIHIDTAIRAVCKGD